MKAGKAAELDGCAVEYLKSGSTSVIECLVILLKVSNDWHDTIIGRVHG